MPDNMRINIRAMTPDERGFSYTQPDLIEASGCIGHLRVDMGTTGTQFFSSWDDHQASLKTQDFKAEFDAFINALRSDPEYDGILTNRASMASYCLRHPEAGFENSRDYGFRANTDKYSYIDEGDTDAEGKLIFSMLPIGKYFVQETATLDGYVLDDTPIPIELSNDGDVVTKEITNASALGNVSVTKTDAETGAPLSGVHFILTDASGTSVGGGTTDETGVVVFSHLPLGTYTLTETETRNGYILDATPREVTISTNGQTVEVSISNTPARGSVSIVKTDSETGAALASVHFKLLDEAGALAAEGDTGTDGTLTLPNIPVGYYILRETATITGYLLDDTPISVEIRENGQIVQINATNTIARGGVTVTKTDSETGAALKGVHFKLFDAANNLTAEGDTDENGKLILNGLPLSSYTLKETTAIDGYAVDETPIPVEITENGQKLEISVENTPFSGSLEITKKAAHEDIMLMGAGYCLYDSKGEQIKEGYGIAPNAQNNAFLATIGVSADDRYADADEQIDGVTFYYFQSDVLINGLKTALENNATDTKNALENYVVTGGGQKLAATDAYGHTGADNVPLGLYLFVETKVPEMVTETTAPFLVSVPMTSVNGTNASDGGTRWIYDVTLYPKNLTGIPSLEKTLREAKADTGKNGGSASITDGYAHTGTASAGDGIDYQIISTLPSITSASTYLSDYTFVDKLSKGIVYNKGDVVLEFFKDAACTNKITTWTEAGGKFAVAYNTASNGDNVMTVSMTEAGLAEINASNGVYTGANMVNSGYSDCTLRITYAAKVKSDAAVVYGDAGNSNEVALKWSRTNSGYYDTLVDDAHPLITFNFLISLCYTQLFNLLCEKADDVYSGRLPVHVRCLIDEAANIGQIPRLEKLVATIRSREISCCLVLQAQSQLKALYKDNADTIIGNMDCSIFLGGKEPTTLKELATALGKETIDTFNTGESRGREVSHSLNYQKLGKELMSVDELAVLDGGKCILQLRGVRPFLSDKYDITKHPNYKLTADFDERNTFDVQEYLQHRLKLKGDKVCSVYEADLPETTEAPDEAIPQN